MFEFDFLAEVWTELIFKNQLTINVEKFKEYFKDFEYHVEYDNVLSILETLSEKLRNKFFKVTEELKGKTIAFF